MVTTIQLHENVKQELDKMKQNSKETYEQVIIKLLRSTEQQRRSQEELLIEGYKEMAEDSLKLAEEWSNTELDWD